MIKIESSKCLVPRSKFEIVTIVAAAVVVVVVVVAVL